MLKCTFIHATILFLPVLAFSATITVPDDYPTIQEAIDATEIGDTVLVKPGTYAEMIDFKGKAITVASEQGPTATVIDGNQRGSVVSFESGEGNDSILDGFTVTNGSGTFIGLVTYGGGINCIGSSPTIQNNIITTNSADEGGGICTYMQAHLIIHDNQIIHNTAVFGGGINCWSSSPEIKNNTIAWNTATEEGGGLQCNVNCSPVVDSNIFRENTATEFGGGMEFWNQCSPVITNNLITGNTALLYRGGGILIATNSSGVISENVIVGNTAQRSGGGVDYEENVSVIIEDCIFSSNTATYNNGGAIFCRIGCNTECSNCIFSGNSAGWNGGGIFIYDSCDATLVNCQFTGNSVGQWGGAIRIGAISNATLANCTFHGNNASEAGGAFAAGSDLAGPINEVSMVNCILWGDTSVTGPEIALNGLYPAELDISYSDVEAGEPGVYIEPGFTLIWGPGMIDADPLFVDGAGEDLHICHPSPCCDTGDNGATGLPAEDFEGDPRTCYSIVDMGADEFYTHLYVTGDKTPGGSICGKLVGLPGSAPAGLFVGSGVLPSPVNTMWGEFWLQSPWALFYLYPIPSDGILVLTTTLPGSIPAPYDVPMQALIGLNPDSLTNLCVLEVR